MQLSSERLSTGDDLPSGHWSHHASPYKSIMYVPAAQGAHILGPSLRDTRANPAKHLQTTTLRSKNSNDFAPILKVRISHLHSDIRVAPGPPVELAGHSMHEVWRAGAYEPFKHLGKLHTSKRPSASMFE